MFNARIYDTWHVHYCGYRAYLIDDNGNPVKELSVGEAYDDNGYVRVFMLEDGEGVGHLMVTYKATLVQKISYVITAVTTLFIIALAIFKNKKKRRTGE